MSYEEEFTFRISAILRDLKRKQQGIGDDSTVPEVLTGNPASAAEPMRSDVHSITGQELPCPARTAHPVAGGPVLFSHDGQKPYYWRNDEVFRHAVAKFSFYLQVEREHYFPKGVALNRELRSALDGFYSKQLLDQVRVVHSTGQRVSNPWFYSEAKAAGLTNLPDIAHKATVTFLDVVVFNEPLTMRDLFHGMVHAAQVRVLGVEQFSDLFVRGFLRARSYFLVPLKAHAFALDARFASAGETRFSVEDEVLRWTEENRY